MDGPAITKYITDRFGSVDVVLAAAPGLREDVLGLRVQTK
jgi:hypothetical protein